MARDGETEARAEAERQREKFERFEYGRTMQVAHQEWRENNVAATLALLDSTRPDLRGWEWRYVHRLCHSDLLTLKGHTVGSLRRRSARTGRGSSPRVGDETAKVWDATTRRRGPHAQGAHRSIVSSASFSPDGSRIVTASWDRTAKVWDATTRCRGPHPQGAHRCRPFGVVQPGRVAGRHRELRTGRRRSGTRRRGAEVLTLKGHTDAVASASFSPDGSRVVTASGDRTAKVWDAKTGAEVLTLKGHTDRRHFGVVQPGRVAGRHRESGQDGEGLGRDDRCRGPHPQGAHRLTSLRRRSARTGRGSSPRVTTRRRRSGTRRTGAEVLTLKGHTDHGHFGVVQPGRVAGRHRESRRDGEGLGRDDRRRGPHPQGAHRCRLFGVVQPGRVAGRHRERGQDGEGVGRDDRRRGPHAQGAHRCRHFGVVQPGRVAGRHRESGQDGEGLGREDRCRGPHAQGAHRCRHCRRRSARTGRGSSPASCDETAKVWDAKTGAEVLTLKGHTDLVSSASFSPDGSRVVTASEDKTAKVWDAKTGAEVLTLKGHTDAVTSASFSPDGSRIVTASDDKTAKVWDAKTGAEVLTLKGHTVCRPFGVVQPGRVADRHRE